MRGLITDRSYTNVARLRELSKKHWINMTDKEQVEWSGDPLKAVEFGLAEFVNLLPHGPYVSETTSVNTFGESITAITRGDGNYHNAYVIVGSASDFEGKTMTLSVESVYSESESVALELYWYENGLTTFAGGHLTVGGSQTFALTENSEKREFLALYVHDPTKVAAPNGAVVRFNRVMLEFGDVAHPYIPYTEIVATPATKGAYNYSDLNRVERMVAEIGESFGLSLVTKTDWTVWDVPKQSDLERYLANVRRIRDCCPNKKDIPNVPDTLNFEGANTIEKILIAAFPSIEIFHRSGELFCGEV